MQWITPFRPSAKQANGVQLAREYTSIEIRLLSGEHTILRTESWQQLRTVFDLVTSQIGAPHSCQTVVISETRCKSRGLSALMTDVAHSWTARKSTKSLVLGFVNYMLLPQVVGRELNRQGLYHWAKASLQQGLKERPQGTVTLRVHMLSGHMLSIDMPGECSLQEVQALVLQESGILLDRQRITIEGVPRLRCFCMTIWLQVFTLSVLCLCWLKRRLNASIIERGRENGSNEEIEPATQSAAKCLPPSKLMHMSNQLLLGSMFTLRAAGQAASWASHTLRRHLWGASDFPLTVKTQLGQTVTVNATMDTTVAELHAAVSPHLAAAPTEPESHFPLQEVTFDPFNTPAASKVLETVSADGLKGKSDKPKT